MLKRWDRFEDAPDFEVFGFGQAADKLLVREVLDGRKAVYKLDLADKADKELMFAHPQVDIGGAIKWPGTNRVVGFWYETDRYQRAIFDAEAAAVFEVVDKSLPGTTNYIVDSARDGKLLLGQAHSDVLPRQYYLLDLERKALRKLSGIAPDLAQTPLAPMKAVKVTAADGTILPGYLTVPMGAEAKNLPMVIYPHGGPHSRDSLGFDHIVQFMVSRGYAVLQVNFRGSPVTAPPGTCRRAQMGHGDGRRRECRHTLGDSAGHRGSEAHLHRRLEFRRIRRAHGRDP